MNNNAPALFAHCFLHPASFRIANRPRFSKQEYWVQIDWATIIKHIRYISPHIVTFSEYTKIYDNNENAPAEMFLLHFIQYRTFFKLAKFNYSTDASASPLLHRVSLLFLSLDFNFKCKYFIPHVWTRVGHFWRTKV